MLGKFIETNENTKRVVIDIETYDPYLKSKGVSWIYNEGFIIGIACKIDDQPSEYYPIRHQEENYDKQQCKNYFYNLFSNCYDHDIPIIAHYSQYDLGWLDHEGFIDIGRCPPLRDTLIGGQLYKSDMTFSLKMMAKFFQVGEKTEIEINDLFKMPVNVVEAYACNDSDLTARIDSKLESLLRTNELTALLRENGIIPLIVMMKKNGIKIDEEKLLRLEFVFKSKLEQRQLQIDAVYPNAKIWSNKDLEFVFRRLNLGYPRTEFGNPSFTASFLDSVKHPVVKVVAEARKIDRLLNGFLGGIKTAIVNGKIHSDYFNGRSEGGGTITGRLSSANPNMQQVPSRTDDGLEVRSLFIPDNLAWARFDYSQQEPRLMLHYAKLLDLPTMDRWNELYKLNPDTDFYDVLMEITGIKDRGVMKTNTLALSYGMGEDHMASIMGILVEEARAYKYRFGRDVPWLSELAEYVKKRAIQKGEIKTLGNRYLKFSQGTAQKAFNHMIQGSAADQTKQAMIDIYKITGKVPLSQIHDELNYDFTEDDVGNEMNEVINRIMKDGFKLEFPIKVDMSLGYNWRECCEK